MNNNGNKIKLIIAGGVGIFVLLILAITSIVGVMHTAKENQAKEQAESARDSSISASQSESSSKASISISESNSTKNSIVASVSNQDSKKYNQQIHKLQKEVQTAKSKAGHHKK